SSCQVAWNAVARMRALSLLCIHLIVHASPCLLHLARISLASNPQTLSLSAWRTDCGRESNASNSFCLLMGWILTHMGWVKRKFGKMYDRAGNRASLKRNNFKHRHPLLSDFSVLDRVHNTVNCTTIKVFQTFLLAAGQ